MCKLILTSYFIDCLFVFALGLDGGYCWQVGVVVGLCFCKDSMVGVARCDASWTLLRFWEFLLEHCRLFVREP